MILISLIICVYAHVHVFSTFYFCIEMQILIKETISQVLEPSPDPRNCWGESGITLSYCLNTEIGLPIHFTSLVRIH